MRATSFVLRVTRSGWTDVDAQRFSRARVTVPIVHEPRSVACEPRSVAYERTIEKLRNEIRIVKGAIGSDGIAIRSGWDAA